MGTGARGAQTRAVDPCGWSRRGAGNKTGASGRAVCSPNC